MLWQIVCVWGEGGRAPWCFVPEIDKLFSRESIFLGLRDIQSYYKAFYKRPCENYVHCKQTIDTLYIFSIIKWPCAVNGQCSYAFRLHGHRRKSLRQIRVKTMICMLYNVIWFSNMPPTRTDQVYDNSLFHSRRQRCHVMYFKITCVATSFLLQGVRLRVCFDFVQ